MTTPMSFSPRIFLWINGQGPAGARALAMDEEGNILATSDNLVPWAALDALARNTVPYWNQFPCGWTLEMIPIGTDARGHYALGKACEKHLHNKRRRESLAAVILEGGSNEA